MTLAVVSVFPSTTGGEALGSYDEFKKAEREGNFYICRSRMMAMRPPFTHRHHRGSDAMLKVKFMSGGYIGVIEEGFDFPAYSPAIPLPLAGRNL